jgi:curli biogenesis system outer membrane secretion channel CsgG
MRQSWTNARIGWAALAMAGVLLVAGAAVGGAAAADEDMEAEEGVLLEPVPEVPGPRRTVAVGGFETNGTPEQVYTGMPVESGLAAMLVTALRESGRFIVVERTHLQQVLAEQELAAGSLTKKEGRPEVGQLYNAQLIIYGAVTEFGAADKGGGFSVGVGGGGLLGNKTTAGASIQSNTGKVAIDIRLVDTTTGEVVDSFTVKEKAKSKSFDVAGGYSGITMGTNRFYKTPLGEASRKAITRAVAMIAQRAGGVNWTSLVVEVDGETVYINAGDNAGLRPGDQFLVERVVKKLTDPATGETLSIRKAQLATVTLTTVEPKLSYGNYAVVGGEAPQRGDLVVKAGP